MNSFITLRRFCRTMTGAGFITAMLKKYCSGTTFLLKTAIPLLQKKRIPQKKRNSFDSFSNLLIIHEFNFERDSKGVKTRRNSGLSQYSIFLFFFIVINV